MHDFSLGGPVDMGEYEGLLLSGKPLHEGSCEDGVYGCRKCGDVFRMLTPEQRKELRDPNNPEWRSELNPTTMCDWCKKEVPVKDVWGIRPWDEPSCYYEVCMTCHGKYNADLDDEYDGPDDEPDDNQGGDWDDAGNWKEQEDGCHVCGDDRESEGWECPGCGTV